MAYLGVNVFFGLVSSMVESFGELQHKRMQEMKKRLILMNLFNDFTTILNKMIVANKFFSTFEPIIGLRGGLQSPVIKRESGDL